MKPFYFGAANRRLLGILERSTRPQIRTSAVLLCNPFGEEAVRAHRIYRVFATQLARAGYPSLRFDYSSTGDSSGDGAGANIEDWIADVASAAEELRAASSSRRIVAVGLRLGGTLAALAASRRGMRLRHVLLWDPIVDGAAYLRELATQHRDYMREEMKTTGWTSRAEVSAEGFPREALGVAVSPGLAAAIAKVDLAAEEIRADHVTVVSTAPAPGGDRLRARLAETSTARWIETSTSVPWNSDAALNNAVVPMDIVQTLIARIEEVSP